MAFICRAINCLSSFSLVLWAAVIVGAVLGRIIEPQNEVINDHPELMQAQLITWLNQYFDSSTHNSKSHTYDYDVRKQHDSSFTIQRAGYTARMQHNGPSAYYGSLQRENTRKFDVNRIHKSESRDLKPKVDSGNLEWMLKNVFTYPRNHDTNETAKNTVRTYIIDYMETLSELSTSVQQFHPVQFMGLYSDQSQIPVGSNIIGILKGREWGKSTDRPVVIGAHWDTVKFTPGTDDNGSGVAAMLEAARAISSSGCRPKYTLIFVAFDLEEVGSQGSLVFIKDYLIDLLRDKYLPQEVNTAKLQGAFILDTIMDFNATDNSQVFPADWRRLVPDVEQESRRENYRGDFISVIYRRNVDNILAEKLNYHWKQSHHESKFRMKQIPLLLSAELPEINVLADHFNFLRSDHSRFWYMNDSSVPDTFQSVLITDTGPYRGNMASCYHTLCDGPEILIYENPDNLKFLEKITQTLTDTLVDMSECEANSVRNDVKGATQNFINTANVNAVSSSYKHGSPLRHLLNFVKWMNV